MTPRVVAFEGSVLGDYHATWGAAALRLGSELVNPTTGFRTEAARLDELAERGALSPISPPINISEEDCESPLLVVAIRESSPFATSLSIEPGRLGGIIKRLSRDGIRYYILRNRESLRQYARDVAFKIVRTVLDDEQLTENHVPAIRAGLALDSSQPHLNALRAYLAPDPASIYELSRACVRGGRALATFDEFYQALTGGAAQHELLYKKGITHGGGLDVDRLLDILKGLVAATEKLVPEIKREWPFLPLSFQPRVSELVPGSAKLVFKVNVEETSIGDRVGRYLQLRALEKALRGETPRELRDDPHFENAIERVVRPTPDTNVLQKELRSNTAKQISFEEPDEADVVRDKLVLLALFTGLATDTGKIEVRLLSGTRRRLFLNYRDNGSGEVPKGADVLSGSTVRLHQLCRLSVWRETDTKGRERYRLREFGFVKPGASVTIHAIPSAIVPGAYRLTKPLLVEHSGRRVFVGDYEVDKDFREQEGPAQLWLDAYEATCEEIELTDPKMKWAAAAHPPSVSSMARVLVALSSLGGEATAATVAEEASRRYERTLRVNNTRRACLHHPDYMEFLEGDERIMTLTELGTLYVKAYRAAGGDFGIEPE